MIWSLQALRFVAAAMVVYVHAAQSALTATGSTGLFPIELAVTGRSGVDIFFVISGVVIAKTAPTLTPIEFQWRRIRRIWPFYIFFIIPAILIAAKTGFGWRDLLATITLWPATDQMTPPLLPVAWTLCFEMLFYFCTSLVLFSRGWLLVLGCFFAAAFSFHDKGPLFQFLGNPIILEFLFGVGLAYLPAYRMAIWGIPAGFCALGLTGFVGLAPGGDTLDFLIGHDNLSRVLVYGVPASFIVYGTMQIKMQRNVWTYLGEASYALYLVHTFIIAALLPLWLAVPVPADVIIIVGITTSILASWRIHELIELPILRFLPAKLTSLSHLMRTTPRGSQHVDSV